MFSVSIENLEIVKKKKHPFRILKIEFKHIPTTILKKETLPSHYFFIFIIFFISFFQGKDTYIPFFFYFKKHWEHNKRLSLYIKHPQKIQAT